MKKMSSNEIRESWVNFFESKKHLFIEPASLVPINDDSLLWINSGVATLKKYFSGKENPPSKRLVNYQKSLRTNDIENVGKTSRHQTLFEMLGNFSIGDYFKKEAIQFAFELLTNNWEINKDKLWITTYKEDKEIEKIWLELGIKKERIINCGKERNFWDLGSGPCGGCTEIFYDRGEEYDYQKLGTKLIIEDIENDRFIEIWNLVFSEFNNNGDGTYSELKRKNIDTGAGLERLTCISQNVNNNFETDLFINEINIINKYSNVKYKEDDKKDILFRIIVDHLRAVLFAISDGVLPSNKERGYIIRRLFRRSMVSLFKLNIEQFNIIIEIIKSFVNNLKSHYKYLVDTQNKVLNILEKEFLLFQKTLKQGLIFLEEKIQKNKIDSYDVFELFSTYGFPIELTQEILEEKKIQFNIKEYEKWFEEHKEKSKNKKNLTNFEKQNNNLINLNCDSKFTYFEQETQSKVLYLLNKDFEFVKELNNEEGYVIFDKTPFYATSGGQQNDTGWINDTYFIDDVFKNPNLIHIHHLEEVVLKENEIVNLKINKKGRKNLSIHHTTEHLLHSSLKKNISSNIKQEGAFKSTEKITFDFMYENKLTKEDLLKIENWVNEQIKKELNIEVLMMELEEAKKNNAAAYFEDVYKKINSKLRVIKIGDVSLELCGGTHLDNTSDIGIFNIISYKSKGSGTWRIEGVSTLEKINSIKNNMIKTFIEENKKIIKDKEKLQDELNKELKNKSLIFAPEILENKKNKILEENNKLLEENNKKQLEKIKEEIKKIDSKKIVLIFNEENINEKLLKNINSNLINIFQEHMFIVLIENFEKNRIILFTNKNNNLSTKTLIEEIIKKENLSVKFGGSDKYIQGGTIEDINKLKEVFKKHGFKIWE